MPCRLCGKADGTRCNRPGCPANQAPTQLQRQLPTHVPPQMQPPQMQQMQQMPPQIQMQAPMQMPQMQMQMYMPPQVQPQMPMPMPMPMEVEPKGKQRCNHCRDELAVFDVDACDRCRGRVCARCAARLERGCPRRKRLQERLWIPSENRREVDSAFFTPVICPGCRRATSPRALRPTGHGTWSCDACLDPDEVAALLRLEFLAKTREQVCGTWNMQKYGKATSEDKRRNVLDGLVAMLRGEDPDWILVQEVTSGTQFVADLQNRLGRERLPYACSGHEVTLGQGSSLDHYILIYHVEKVAIVVGPRHVGANEAPEQQSQVRYWRDKKEGIEGKVLPHRGSVVWLTCALPYQGPSSLSWVMGVHTSPSGATNKIATQIHEIMTHAAKLRHMGVPVVLAGDWYMQNCAPGYATKLDAADWTLLATYYGTSLKHKNTAHEIQAADHLVVSDMCSVAWVRQYVPASSPDRPLSLAYLNTPPCLDAKSFLLRSTPEHIWELMSRWMAMSIDHTPVLARFTIEPGRARPIFVPGNLTSTIEDWQRSGLTSPQGIGDRGPRTTHRGYVTPSTSLGGGSSSTPHQQPPTFNAPFGTGSPSTPRLQFGAPTDRTLSLPSPRLADDAWWPYLHRIEGVQLFGSHQSGATRLTCVRLPALKQKGPAECGIHAAYNALALRVLAGNPTQLTCQQVIERLTDPEGFQQATQGWVELRKQLALTDGIHLPVISGFLGNDHLALPMLNTGDNLAVFEDHEVPRVKQCVDVLAALGASPGAHVLLFGRVQWGGQEAHAVTGILRSFISYGRITWELIFADSAPNRGFDDDTMKLFKAIVRWLDHPDIMLERSKQDLEITL